MGTIRDEIRQTRPFESAADEAVVTLLATGDRVRTALTRVTEAHAITLQQYNVLRIPRGAGENGLPTLEIATRMIEKSPGITRLLDRLEARRLVRRVRCPEDRRQVLCHATEAARRLLDGLDRPVAEADPRLIYRDPFGNGRRYFADLDHGVEQLLSIYNDEDDTKLQMIVDARRFVEARTWDIPIAQLKKSIREITAETDEKINPVS